MKKITVNFVAPESVNERINAHVAKSGMKKGRWLLKSVEDALSREQQKPKKK